MFLIIRKKAYFYYQVIENIIHNNIKMKDGTKRANIHPGLEVRIVLKADQKSGKLTEGVVKKLLTNSHLHPHGIKVMLEDGQVGRVQEIID